LLGTHADDRTNEVNRVADAHLLIRAMLHGHPAFDVGVLNAVDHDRIALMGHSYGAYTALATVAGSRGVPPHDRVRAVVGFQPYTRSMSDSLLGRVTRPTLLVVSERDQVTPAGTDADRPWALLRGEPTWRVDLTGAGHQAISDIALYAELARELPNLPDIVKQYLTASNADAGAPGVMTWRELMRVQVAAAWTFLTEVLDLDPDADPLSRAQAVDALGALPGVTLRRR
jgi:predicted dienelactone hydrolase